MYRIKDDQRSIRSCEMIFEGLAALMNEKAYADITVTDLVKAAGVGRTTFYRHFDEIEDVLRMRCDRVVEGLIDYLQAYRQAHAEQGVGTILKPVLRYFHQHSEMIELLMKARRIHIFEEMMLRSLEPFKPMFGLFFGIEEAYVEYVMTMRLGAITNILTHWVATGKQQDPDDLADKLGAISNMVALEQLL